MTEPNSEPFDYDEVPYPGAADPDTHLRQLEAVGLIHGLAPADIAACRVLELGCASGRNLIPQAVAFPNSQFVGVDLAQDQVRRGQEDIAALGLSNIELHHTDLTTLDEAWGEFDYIFCPGVLSWIPTTLRTKLFSVCCERLSETGLALISYNTLPGWYMHNVTRDMMRYHVQHFDTPDKKALEARKIIKFAVENSNERSTIGKLLRDDDAFLARSTDSYLYHDFLVDHCHPLYFHEFVDAIEDHQLQYVADARHDKASTAFMPPASQPVFARTPRIQRNQLIDFLHGGSYRKSVITHQERTITRCSAADLPSDLHWSLRHLPKQRDFVASDDSPAKLSFPSGELTVRAPLGKIALRKLIDCHPRCCPSDEIVAAASELGAGNLPAEQRDILFESLLSMLDAGLVNVYRYPPEFATSMPTRPTTTAHARREAAGGHQISSLRHDMVQLGPFDLWILKDLDGSRTVDQWVQSALAAIRNGTLPTDPSHTHSVPPTEAAVRSRVQRVMKDFLQHALLCADDAPTH